MPSGFHNTSLHLTNEQIAAKICTPLKPIRSYSSIALTVLSFVLAGIAILPLFSLLWTILSKGIPLLSWESFTSLPAPVGQEGVANGFANAIVGTLTMVFMATLISVPVGICTAIYIAEFTPTTAASSISSIVRFTMQVLSGVPSIVVGVFAYAVIVLTFKGFSAIAGSIALTIVMLPIISLTTEGALKLVPISLRLASSGLGASRFQTIARIVLPTALPSITTGILLAISRAAGETAPLIFTALFSQNWAQGLDKPTPSLSVMIYNYSSSPFIEQNKLSWAACVVLVVLVLVSSVLSRLATQRRIKLR
ncbi:MAG: phosphate ABC transporter permease PstA [Leptolyngbyaceae bacterium]|nr:phosphate ABC transporter permease PstA [Leptolyngbyaceae bacterium]